MRLESEFVNDTFSMNDLALKLKLSLAKDFKMKWCIYSSQDKPKIALFVSKYDDCLYDILGRYNS